MSGMSAPTFLGARSWNRRFSRYFIINNLELSGTLGREPFWCLLYIAYPWQRNNFRHKHPMLTYMYTVLMSISISHPKGTQALGTLISDTYGQGSNHVACLHTSVNMIPSCHLIRPYASLSSRVVFRLVLSQAGH
jgi:hypothetical protein